MLNELVRIKGHEITVSAEHIGEGRHSFRQGFTGTFGHEQGHVIFGKFVALFKESGAVVLHCLRDRVVGGGKITHRDHVILIRRKAPIEVVKGFLDDPGGESRIELDLLDGAQHLGDFVLGDGVLLIHIKII